MPDQEMEKDRWPRLSVAYFDVQREYRARPEGEPAPDGRAIRWNDAYPIETYVPLSELEEAESRATHMEDLAREKGDALVVMKLNAADAEQRAEAAEKALKEALAALDHLRTNAGHIFDKHPVRDWGETLAEADRVLATHNDNEEDPNA